MHTDQPGPDVDFTAFHQLVARSRWLSKLLLSCCLGASVCAAAGFLWVGSSSIKDSEGRATALKTDNDGLQTSLRSSQDRVQQLTAKVKELEARPTGSGAADIQNLQDQIAELKRRLRESQGNTNPSQLESQLRAQIDEKQATIDRQQSTIDSQSETIGDLRRQLRNRPTGDIDRLQRQLEDANARASKAESDAQRSADLLRQCQEEAQGSRGSIKALDKQVGSLKSLCAKVFDLKQIPEILMRADPSLHDRLKKIRDEVRGQNQ